MTGNSILESDCLLPDQYMALVGGGDNLSGERRLMLAVLEDALDRYRRFALARDPRGRAEYQSAREWIDDDEREWLYSFENVCEVMGFDATYLRERLARAYPSRRLSIGRSPQLVPLGDLPEFEDGVADIDEPREANVGEFDQVA
ncbi:MAG: hypothetical protein HRT46_00835 [Deltaproteobacteria bacterium]|nr:hypothetical protein [Deltaproteobacteria bacterium]